jgi:NAD(P)-dependent dehydrogenase (short-subunit alcohol dehydrogenase family)
MPDYPKPPYPSQQQPMPGSTNQMDPVPDHGENSYKGSGRLTGKRAIITGGDSGIGRAVALAYAREGADVVIAYLEEDDDAKDTAHQASFKDLQDITDEEWDLTFRVNIHAMFYLVKAAVPHMKPGSAIINTASINSDDPNPILLAYATTKGAIHNFTAGLAQLLAEKGIRVNAVAPGPIWTPLIPSTMPPEAVKIFGQNTPMKRAGQPAELATTYVMLADPLSSYVSGATVAVTGGRPFL